MTRLIVRLPNWLGDLVMALPSLAAIRRTWRDTYVAVALPRAFAPLAAVMPGVDATVPLEGRGWRDHAGMAADVAALRAGAFDTAILFTNSYGSARVVARAGIAERWGYRTAFRGWLLTRALPPRRPPHDRHQARYYARLVEQLGSAPVEDVARLEVPTEWRARGEQLLAARGVAARSRIVGIAPGAAYGTAKRWPPEAMADLVERCVHDDGAVCVLVGSGGDVATGVEIEQRLLRRGTVPIWPGQGSGQVARGDAGHASGGVVNVIGRTDLPTLAGVLGGCERFVSNDSGAMHLASALGVPVVALFGPTDERATAPLGPHTLVTGRAWCRPCLRRECPIDHRCMSSISPAQVFDAVRSEPRARM
jgi:heptosyltransferase-2